MKTENLRVDSSNADGKPSSKYTTICNVCGKINESTFTVGELTVHTQKTRELTAEEFEKINEIFKKLGGRKEVIPFG